MNLVDYLTVQPISFSNIFSKMLRITRSCTKRHGCVFVKKTSRSWTAAGATAVWLLDVFSQGRGLMSFSHHGARASPVTASRVDHAENKMVPITDRSTGASLLFVYKLYLFNLFNPAVLLYNYCLCSSLCILIREQFI